MAYKLIVTQRADELIDRLTAYLVNHLKNPGAASHFLDELETIYHRLEENPFQFAVSKDEYLSARGYRDALFRSIADAFHRDQRLTENTPREQKRLDRGLGGVLQFGQFHTRL